jgi:hypothetical protein
MTKKRWRYPIKLEIVVFTTLAHYTILADFGYSATLTAHQRIGYPEKTRF